MVTDGGQPSWLKAVVPVQTGILTMVVMASTEAVVMPVWPPVFAVIIEAARQSKALGGIRVDNGIELLIGGWLDHNLAAQAVAVVDDDFLLRTRLHGIRLLQDLRHGSLHHRCIRLEPRRIDVRTGNSKHQGLQHDGRSLLWAGNRNGAKLGSGSGHFSFDGQPTPMTEVEPVGS